MLKNSLLLMLSLAVIFVMGCDKDESTGPSETVDEFKLLTDIGDEYFSTYTTPSGLPVNTSISAVFPVLADDDASNDPFIIDYRSADAFASGHLKGAVNISLESLVEKIDDGTIPADQTILNVCFTGQISSYATAALNMLGYDAQNLLFGMCGVTNDESINGSNLWNDAAKEDEFASQFVSEETVPTKEYEFAEIATGESDGIAVFKTRLKEVLSTPPGWGRIGAADVFASLDDHFIINYWPKAEYLDPGHIPTAVCFEPKDAFKADQMLKYLPTDKTIVVYCYTGQTSAQLAAYLQVLGYDAKSLLYGVNGFAYEVLSKSKYTAPTNDYSSIIVK